MLNIFGSANNFCSAKTFSQLRPDDDGYFRDDPLSCFAGYVQDDLKLPMSTKIQFSISFNASKVFSQASKFKNVLEFFCNHFFKS